jgi:hypothetical protein
MRFGRQTENPTLPGGRPGRNQFLALDPGACRAYQSAFSADDNYFATARSINGAGNATSPSLGSRATPRVTHFFDKSVPARGIVIPGRNFPHRLAARRR